MKIRSFLSLCSVLLLVSVALAMGAQEPGSQPESAPPAQAAGAPTYQPKFPGDPAHSEAEAQALGYMRTALRAEKLYKKRHDKYAGSLAALAGTGSFTKRMARSTNRGDYTVNFHPNKDGYSLAMIPKQFDAQHRAFYAEEDGVIRVEDDKPANADSPKLK
jgi:hypothetical protein